MDTSTKAVRAAASSAVHTRKASKGITSPAAAAAAPTRASVDSIRCEFLAALSARAMILAQHYQLDSSVALVPVNASRQHHKVLDSPREQRRLQRAQRRRQQSDPRELLESLSSHYGTHMMHLADDAAAAHASLLSRSREAAMPSTTQQHQGAMTAQGIRWSARAARRYVCPTCHAVYLSRCSGGNTKANRGDDTTTTTTTTTTTAAAADSADSKPNEESAHLTKGVKYCPTLITCTRCKRAAVMEALSPLRKLPSKRRRSSSTPPSVGAAVAPTAFSKKPCRRKRRRGGGTATPAGGGGGLLAEGGIAAPQRQGATASDSAAVVRRAGAPPSAGAAGPRKPPSGAPAKKVAPASVGGGQRKQPLPKPSTGTKSAPTSTTPGDDFLGALGL